MEEKHAWVPWFRELAGKIAAGGEEYLIKQAKQVDWRKNTPALLKYGDEKIDPFSFFYFLAQSNTKNQREPVYRSVAEVFGISDQKSRSLLTDKNLTDGFIFPTPISIAPALFHDGKKGNPVLFWRLFRQAIGENIAIKSADFTSAINTPFVDVAKLTQCLFLINPHYFMPIDKGILAFHVQYNLPFFKEAADNIGQKNGWEYYKNTLEKFRVAFKEKTVYEINTELYFKGQQKGNQQAQTKNNIEEKPSNNNKQDKKQMKHPLNQILYGPPGTGKTWNAVNHALAIIEGEPVQALENENRDSVKQRFDRLKASGQIEMITFHQSFSYEDFIEGIKPVLGNKTGDDPSDVQYEIVAGVFKRIADRATKNWHKLYASRNYVLIIDEINRGNIAKIFGELITLVEDTKRIGNEDQTTLALPYSSKEDDTASFGVPNNLYIIGTMNTADRSIALLDTALRRRFHFIEMMPQPGHPLISDDVNRVNCRELLTVMNERISALLDREHQIGHSYFISVDSMDKLADVFKNKIIPLLQEYFYDDWAKIDLVLGHNKFITGSKINSRLFGDTELVDTRRLIYTLIGAGNKDWHNPENYRKIYTSVQNSADNNDAD